MTSATLSQLDTANKTTVNDAQFDNFFALFEQPIQFELAQQELDQRLRALQKRYHPDNVEKNSVESSSGVAIQQAEQASAIINQAYQTLSNPDSRAAYLLALANKADDLENSIADLDFLEDAMEMRINLDDAIDDKDRATLQQLHPQIAERLQNQSKRFSDSYASQDWNSAIDATQKLKFLVKLNADITIALDEVADSNQTDDDLYV